jgi:hypothetical protein
MAVALRVYEYAYAYILPLLSLLTCGAHPLRVTYDDSEGRGQELRSKINCM